MNDLLRGNSAIFEDHEHDATPYIIGPSQIVSIPKSRHDLELHSLKSHQGALNAMYETSCWVPQQKSDETKLSHFNSFFAEKHHTRQPLPEKTSLTEIIDTLVKGMRLIQSSKVWLKCFWNIKLHIRFKHRIRIFCAERTKERTRLLAEMLQYWQDAEKKKVSVARKAIEEMAVLSPDKYKQRAVGLSALLTPDTIKSMVLWELYWLLRTQLSYKRSIYRKEKSRLIIQRKKAMELMKVHRSGAQKDLADINAALFTLFLQEPTLKFNPRSIPFNTLVHLAKVSTSPDSGALVPSCRIFSAFVTLPICTTAAWFQKRRLVAYPLVPMTPPGYMGSNTVRPSTVIGRDDDDSDDDSLSCSSLTSPSNFQGRKKSGFVRPLTRETSGRMSFSTGRSSSISMASQLSARGLSSTLGDADDMTRVGTPTYRRRGQRMVSRGTGQKVVATPQHGGRKSSCLLEREASICAAPPVQSVLVRPFSVSSSRRPLL